MSINSANDINYFYANMHYKIVSAISVFSEKSGYIAAKYEYPFKLIQNW